MSSWHSKDAKGELCNACLRSNASGYQTADQFRIEGAKRAVEEAYCSMMGLPYPPAAAAAATSKPAPDSNKRQRTGEAGGGAGGSNGHYVNGYGSSGSGHHRHHHPHHHHHSHHTGGGHLQASQQQASAAGQKEWYDLLFDEALGSEGGLGNTRIRCVCGDVVSGGHTHWAHGWGWQQRGGLLLQPRSARLYELQRSMSGSLLFCVMLCPCAKASWWWWCTHNCTDSFVEMAT